MKKLMLLILALVVCFSSDALAAPYRQSSDDVYVKGYTRSDGTSVRSHYRSAPDSSTSNNYGSFDY